MNIKFKIIKLHWFLSTQLGLDPLRLLKALKGTPLFLTSLFIFLKKYRGKIELMPCLFDRYEQAGSAQGEYFWQDLYVAQEIFKQAPIRHVDIGSRIDGFVAHVASYRRVEVFDIRPMKAIVHNITFKQLDLMNPMPQGGRDFINTCDSLSCLHAIEHFGLGRYGDSINVDGYITGLQNLGRLLKAGGLLYLSTPVGKERVVFNANWVFNPKKIVSIAKAQKLVLERLVVIDPNDGPKECIINSELMDDLCTSEYKLVIFHFRKSE